MDIFLKTSMLVILNEIPINVPPKKYSLKEIVATFAMVLASVYRLLGNFFAIH